MNSISIYMITVIGKGAVERKVVNQDCWQWLYGISPFTDDMVRDFRLYHDRERIGFTEAYDRFTKATSRGYEQQKERAILLAPSLIRGHFRCGGVGVSAEEINGFCKRHRLWLWSHYECRI